MAKRDLVASINQNLPMKSGEFVTVGALVQVTQLAMTSPFVGDFQITGAGRLIVGADINDGARVIVSPGGLFGYDNDSVRTLAFFAMGTASNGAGDMVIGKQGGNYMAYSAAEGTLGLYSPDGGGFIVDSDGSLFAGDTDAAHMRWDNALRSFQVKWAEEVKISLDATGNASFDGTVYAQGGRIYNNMWVDGLIRAGDVDGPQVVLGRFSRTDDSGDLIESGEIIATDANNLPWFHVTAGGSTAGGGWFHLGGTGDYSQNLTYDGTSLTVSGVVYADAFVLRKNAQGEMKPGSTITSAGKFTAGTGNNVAVIDGENGTWRIYAGHAKPEYAPFRVNQTGQVWMDDATVIGTIEAEAGLIGGWRIGKGYLAQDTGDSSTSAGMAPADYPFYAGAVHMLRSTAPFRVTPDGSLWATRGYVGGWELSPEGLTGNAVFLDRAGAGRFGVDNEAVYLSSADATYRIWVGNATAANATFRVNKLGAVYATNGAIGGWTLGGSQIYSGDATLHNDGYLLLGTGDNVARLDASDATYRLWIGDSTAGDAPFRVTKAGALTATSATITGAITASSGSITGFLTLGSDGGIYQGSGTAGTPTTGLKIWNDGGTGRIAGYNGGTVQWYANTDGKQYFGAGKASLSADGLRFDGEYGAFGETGAIEWVIDSTTELSIGVDDSELPVQSFIEADGNLRLTASMVIVDGQLKIPIVAAASASNQTLYEETSDGELYYKDSSGTAHKLTA